MPRKSWSLRLQARDCSSAKSEAVPAYRICALCCHLGSQFGITLRIFNNSLAGKDHRIQEMTLCNIICISNLAFFQICLCFIYDSFVTDCKYFAIFDGHMSYPIIEIVTWCKNVMFDSFDCFRSHIGCSKFTGCLTFPVFMYSCLVSSAI